MYNAIANNFLRKKLFIIFTLGFPQEFLLDKSQEHKKVG